VYDDASDPLDGGVQGLKIGLPKEYFQDGVDDDVRAAVENAAETLKGRGATLVKVGLPHTPYAIPAYYVIATAEASSNLARFDGVRYGRRAPNPSDLAELYANSRHEGFGPEVRRRILLGTFCLSSGYDAYYEKALRARALIAADFDAAFKSCDVVLGPAAPTPAFKLGEKSSDPLQMYQSDVLTGACNLAGLPGLVLPCGFATRDGARLPIGAQFIGPRGFEARLFRVARALERATGLEGLVATTSGAKR
jgi:aspartyl-tRNA(Asn)/glutamyl-tRNA(Gln) amidotransferase subunit A